MTNTQHTTAEALVRELVEAMRAAEELLIYDGFTYPQATAKGVLRNALTKATAWLESAPLRDEQLRHLSEEVNRSDMPFVAVRRSHLSDVLNALSSGNAGLESAPGRGTGQPDDCHHLFVEFVDAERCDKCGHVWAIKPKSMKLESVEPAASQQEAREE